MKQFLWDVTGPLDAWIHSSCDCPHKIKPVKIPAWSGDRITGRGEKEGRIMRNRVFISLILKVVSMSRTFISWTFFFPCIN